MAVSVVMELRLAFVLLLSFVAASQLSSRFIELQDKALATCR